MKIFIYFIMCVWMSDIQTGLCTYSNLNSNLHYYLRKKISTLHDTLSRRRHQLSKRDTNYVDFEEMRNITYEGEPGNFETANFVEENCLLVGNSLLGLSTIPNQGRIVNLQQNFDRIPNDQRVTFAKAVIYDNFSIILSRLELGEAYIYGFRNERLFFIQTILIPYSTDAHFFIFNDDLFLTVINNRGDNLAESIIYKWQGSHFDEIETFFTTGAMKVTSFSTNTSEIIIILQHLPNTKVWSAIYEFRGYKLKKIQYIETKTPVNLDTYSSGHKRYVIIYGQSKKNMIYLWNGLQMEQMNEFESENVIMKSEIYANNDTSILIVPFNDKLQVYRLSSEDVQMEGEKYFFSNYSAVLGMHTREIEGTVTTVLVGLTDGLKINVKVAPFTMHFTRTESTPKEKNTLRECFNSLEQRVYAVRKKINEMNSEINIDISDTDSGTTEDFSSAILSDALTVETGIEKDLNVIKLRLESVNSFLNNYTITQTNTLIVNGSLILEGSAKADELSGKSMTIRSVNGRKWVPDQWLKYEEPQTITGPVKLKNVYTKMLETIPDDPLVKDLLLKDGNQTITGHIFIGNLTASRIYARKINNIPMERVFLQGNLQPIRSVKTNRKVDEQMRLSNQKEPTSDLPVQSKMNFDSNVAIENLEVETINGIDWNEFVSSVFRIGRDSVITGPLTFSKLKTIRLGLKKLKDMDVEDLLTTSTDQTIHSNMEFYRIFSRNISAETVNNVNLLESAVLLGQNDTIDVPVTFQKLNVVKDLEILGKLDESLYWKAGDHIIGTNESDLLQQYRGKVTIKGNLHLKNLSLQPKAKLTVSKKQMSADLTNTYWTKSTNQKIDHRMTALQGLSTPHILTTVLNDINFSQYMLNNNDEKLETDYHFETVSVNGNVILRNAAQHHPDVKKIGKGAIKTNGSYIIKGKKIYEDTLKAENLATLELDGIDALETLNTKWPANVTGLKVFKDLIVMGNMNSSVTQVPVINEETIEDITDTVIYIDEPQNITSLNFVNLNVSDLLVTKLNDHTIDEYLASSENLLSARIENGIIEGNLTVRNIKELSTINDIYFEDLLEKAPKIGEFGGIVGDVRFTGKVTVGDLGTSFVNSVDLENITQRFLFRKFNQIISAPYSFGGIKAENVVTSKINNVTVDRLIDVSSKSLQEMNSPNVRFTEAILNSIESKSMTPCMLTDLLDSIKDPPSQNWSEIQVRGNVSLLDNENVLYRVLENSVKMNTKNVIFSPVSFSGHVRAENVNTKKNINNLNLTDILEDAILTESNSPQTITGQKWFPSIQAKTVTVLQNADIRIVNGEDVQDLNEVIVNKNKIDQTVIRGKKTFFSGLQTNKIRTKTISNLDPDNIVQDGSTRKVPSALFDTLDVENDLNITFFNNINVRNTLKNRLLVKGVDNQRAKGILFFEYLEAEHLFTPKINQIKTKNIIFDEPGQTISSQKLFKKKVEVFGNIITDSINGMQISEEFKKSVFLRESVSINGSVRVLRPSQIIGDVDTDSINGHLISDLKDILDKSNIKTEVQEIYDLKNRVIEQVQRNIDVVQALPGEYMYLEKSDELQISVQNTVKASTTVSKGYALFHITGYESGGFCGLPEFCQCPQELTLEISPEHSVTLFPNKGFQRSFSYDDESMTVYFTTNSVSTSPNCSTKTSKVLNEVSTLTWNTKSTSNSDGLFYQYDTFLTGHISKVEFFTLENTTYVIVGRYYDPILENYNLDCTVIKFNENRTEATEIQKISTRAVQELHLLHTAQGVVLIIGNTKNSNEPEEEDETQILRFNPVNEKFEHLRTIPSFGCTDATGVVLGSDSLIVLAHKLAPIQVLKYYPDFDNYYAYQSFELDEPVIGITTFYIGGFGMSDAYLCVITENENYFIYEFRFLEGWKKKSTGQLDGLKNFVPFELNKKSYIFAPSSKISSLLTIVKNGSN